MTDAFKQNELENLINQAWDNRDALTPGAAGPESDAVTATLALLDQGVLRVATPENGDWTVHQWVKKAVLLSFRLNPMRRIQGGPDQAAWWDKVDSKFNDWDQDDFHAAGFRAVPGCFVRHSAFIAKNAVLMPCFINVGAHIGEGTMVDTWSTIGSCAQIGKNCHISGGVGIGGVLEPLQAEPVIIEDNVFIGARSEVAEGVRVETGAVISMGVYLGASTKIVNRETGEIITGRVPAYSVVVPGSLPGRDGGVSLSCAVIVKQVDEKTRSKTSINDLLRA